MCCFIHAAGPQDCKPERKSESHVNSQFASEETQISRPTKMIRKLIKMGGKLAESVSSKNGNFPKVGRDEPGFEAEQGWKDVALKSQNHNKRFDRA